MARVLASEDFAGAPQLSAFLSFVVTEALAGRGEQLKGYTIAVEALKRPVDFDPQADPIVRVEAGRLRRALELYYAADGRNDPLRIEIPRGSYGPLFIDMQVEAEQPASVTSATEMAVQHAQTVAAVSPPRQGWLWPLAGVAVAGLLAIAAFLTGLTSLSLGDMFERNSRSTSSLVQTAATKSQTSLPPTPPEGQPTTSRTLLPALIINVDTRVTNPEARNSIGVFIQSLTDAISRFDEFAFVGTLDELQAANNKGRTQEVYVIEISAVVSVAEIEGFAKLIHKPSGRVIWNTSDNISLEKAADQVVLREFARRMAIRIAQPYGLLHADLRNMQGIDPALTCMVSAYDYWRAPTPVAHLKVRHCLETALKADPAFHPAWALLAQITLDEHRSGFNPLPGAALDRALTSALTARSLAPESARAAQAEMDVLFVRGDTEEAIKIGHIAVRRNPFDSDILADLGARLVQTDQPKIALPLLIRAAELNPGRPGWYDFFLFLAARQTGETALARYHAGLLVRDEAPLSLLGRALSKIDSGDLAGAAATLRKLAENEPVFRESTRDFLARRKFVPSLVDELVKTLEKARAAGG
ncbi:MAG: tetratricopeptide repeat protein [Bosea sp. (in: a-proteobacteria)]